MIPFITSKYGNPHSSHPIGKLASEACEQARHHIADLLHTKPSNIIFTSGATEANVTVFKGLLEKYSLKYHIITTMIEHKVIKEVSENINADVCFLKVEPSGLINLDLLES